MIMARWVALALVASLALAPAASAQKISELPAVTTPLAGTELVAMVQGGATKKATVINVFGGITGLVKGNGASAPSAYAGTSCTNQFPRSLDLNGAATCATVGSSDLAASLSLVTPVIGVATGTSLNGNTFTTGTYTLTGAAAKTLTFNNSLTLAGTDATTMTFPGASDTVMGLGATQTNTAAKTFNSGTLKLGGAVSGTTTLNAASAAGTTTLTLPAGTTDFSATGGTSQVVKQVSAGAALTVGQLAAADLSDGNSGTGAIAHVTAPTIVGGGHTALIDFALRDTSAAFDLTLTATSAPALTAGRALTIDMSNVAHTLDLGATANTITFPNTASYTLVGSLDTTLPAAILASSLTSTGALTGGSIASGFGTLATANTIETTNTTASTSAATGALKIGGGLGVAGAIWGGTYMAVTGTTLPTQAAGTLGIGGIAAAPTLAANGEGDIYLSTTGGLQLIGKGSTNDFVLSNSAGVAVITIPTGSAWFQTPHISAASALLLDTAFNANAITITGLSTLITSTNGMAIGAPTGGGKGSGTLNLAGLLYNNNTIATGSGGGYVLATGATLTTPTLTDAINQEFLVSTSTLTKTSDTALATVPGLSQTLTAGKTYNCQGKLTGVSGASGGIKVALVATASLSATSTTWTGFTWSGTTAVAQTTVTALGSNIAANTAVYSDMYINGSIVVNAGGTINVQAAQNVSDGTATTVLQGSTFSCVRVN